MEIRGSFDETWSAATAARSSFQPGGNSRSAICALLFDTVCELFVGETFLLPPSLLSTTMFIVQYP